MSEPDALRLVALLMALVIVGAAMWGRGIDLKGNFKLAAAWALILIVVTLIITQMEWA